MLQPSEFLEGARLLATAGAASSSDAHLRRSISTAYYALFHTVLTASAARFMGSSEMQRPGYAILYRSFGHGRMMRTCEDIAIPLLGQVIRRQLG